MKDITDMKDMKHMKDMTTTQKPSIYINQAGYLPHGTKRVVFPFACEAFTLLDEEGQIRYRGNTVTYGNDEASGDFICRGDFSDFTEEGTFYVVADEAKSVPFQINAHPYDGLLYDLMRGFYFLRCGCELTPKFAGPYTHKICHNTPAMDWYQRDFTKMVSGGWHDAGDYGRYVTPGACAVAHLLYTYVLFGKEMEKREFNLPETGNGIPDLLNEVRYELEWMCKLQKEDGGVYHKVTTQHHAAFVMPEEDTNPLYLLPVSSIATADFAAVCALGTRIYKTFDPDFSQKLKEAALLSYRWLQENPDFLFSDIEECGTGGYGERDDYSNRFWAAAELYALTGEVCYEEDMRKALLQKFPLMALGYGEVGGFGILAYLSCSGPKSEDLLTSFRGDLKDTALWVKDIRDHSGYGVSMQPYEFGWGSNMLVGTRGMLFALADYFDVAPEVNWKEYAQAQLDYLMGINAMGISYVTGNGAYRYNYPHLRPSHADGIEEAIPGMVSGGPNKYRQDEAARRLIPEGTAPMKCYIDHVDSFSTNEITIYWNSPFVFTLAYLLS